MIPNSGILTGQIPYFGLELLIFLFQDPMFSQEFKRSKTAQVAMPLVHLQIMFLLKKWSTEKTKSVRLLAISSNNWTWSLYFLLILWAVRFWGFMIPREMLWLISSPDKQLYKPSFWSGIHFTRRDYVGWGSCSWHWFLQSW